MTCRPQTTISCARLPELHALNTETENHMPATPKKPLGIHWRRTKRETVGIISLSVVLLGGYIWFLDRQETRAAQYFQDLRVAAPDRYLNEIRRISGFEFYLSEYGDLKGFGAYQARVPDFMIGRWSLADQPKRVSDTYRVADCVNPLIFENGRVTYPTQTDPVAATFRLERNQLFVRHPTGETTRVTLVGTGIHLHHIELDLPASDARVFGYACN